MSEIDLKCFFFEQVCLFEFFLVDKVEEIVIKFWFVIYEGNEVIFEIGDEGKVIGVMISGYVEILMIDNIGICVVII